MDTATIPGTVTILRSDFDGLFQEILDLKRQVSDLQHELASAEYRLELNARTNLNTEGA